jgi:hypothetical protein
MELRHIACQRNSCIAHVHCRLRELVLGPGQQVAPGGEGGVLGPLSSIDVELLIPRWVFPTGNIRYMDELAGRQAVLRACCGVIRSTVQCVSCSPIAYQFHETTRIIGRLKRHGLTTRMHGCQHKEGQDLSAGDITCGCCGCCC